jgi:hypothetical protein
MTRQAYGKSEVDVMFSETMNKYKTTKGKRNRKEKQPLRKPVQVRNSVKLSDAINKA